MFDLSLSHGQGAFQLDVALALKGKGVTALFGPSGSGKTTLLRLMAGLDRPDTGRIELEGQVLVDTEAGLFVPVHKRRLGVVFQEARLFPHYSVRGNLGYGMPVRDEPALQRMARLLGIEALLERMPGRLSGGEARRVAIGRALLTRPRLLLLDEPLTGLDGERKQELLGYLAALVRDIEIPVIFVSHDPQELLAVADDLVLMQHGQVKASGPLDTLLAQPELMPYLGGFDVSAMLRVVCQRVDAGRHLNVLRLADGQRLEVPGLNVSPGAVLKIQIRARDVALALQPPEQTSIRNMLRCRITGLHQTATPGVTLVALAVADQVLRALISTASCEALALHEGQEVLALIRAVSLARPA